MKVKNLFITIGIMLVVVVALFFYIFVYPFLMLWFGFATLPGPPKPEIRHGEFPYRLEYEINGETKVVEDVLICEYDGYGINEAKGKYRQWKYHLASGNTRITLFKNEEIEIFYTPAIGQFAAAVYMGDTETYRSINDVFPDAWYTSDFENKKVGPNIISADEMWEKYKIKLISWEPSPPIQNNFK